MTITFERARALSSADKRRLLADLLAGPPSTVDRPPPPVVPAVDQPPARSSRDDDEAALARVREEFLGADDVAYLNFGARGPLARSAADAVRRSLEFTRGQGLRPSAAEAWMEHEARSTRAAFAATLGAQDADVALTESVSSGCALAMWGLPWRAGDHLLLADRENPGIVAAARELGRRLGVEVTEWPLSRLGDGEDPAESLAAHLRPRTRLVVLSHVCWTTGRLADLSAVTRACRAHRTGGAPVRVLVDAAQSAGVVPLSMADAGVDFCAFTAGKWWCGPAGVAGLYVAPAARDEMRPTLAGWRGITIDAGDGGLGWQPDARRYEGGSPAYTLLAGARAALRAHEPGGPPAERLRRAARLAGEVWSALGQIPGVTPLGDAPPGAGIVSFTVAGKSSDELARDLESCGVIVRAMHDPACVRACIHHFTLRAETGRLLAAVRAAAGRSSSTP